MWESKFGGQARVRRGLVSVGIEVRRLIGGEVRVSKRGNRIWSSGKGR